ncbi:hypothetical protein [Nocardia jiangxiensis]|uniref:Uncharacterized protein n=1 Tax=Nocardia jiangxiensis TaxID=282685 RepID=A0ABW6RZQ8_9NOCA|nr:hypothetical protein [Nocardia jiangxiensis]
MAFRDAVRVSGMVGQPGGVAYPDGRAHSRHQRLEVEMTSPLWQCPGKSGDRLGIGTNDIRPDNDGKRRPMEFMPEIPASEILI